MQLDDIFDFVRQRGCWFIRRISARGWGRGHEFDK